jgi:pimeloyl-ACP methyl ester carboxylesterase
MPEIELSAGTIEYEDSGGDGPTIVLIHGVLMDSSLWRDVISDLRADHRCVAPTLPLGGHRKPMRADADLTMRGQTRLIGDFLERLGLSDVVLVAGDWGGPIPFVAGDPRAERVGRLVLTACEAFDNIPPGLPGRVAALAARLPSGRPALAPMRFGWVRRLPFTFGHMSKRPIPDELMDRWLKPALTQPAIWRDYRKYAGVVDRQAFVEATSRLSEFDRPALVAWSPEDRVMPPEHGRRLAALLPYGRLVEIPDSYTLIAQDQPTVLSSAIRAFVSETATAPGAAR